jgi:hypothetical protein
LSFEELNNDLASALSAIHADGYTAAGDLLDDIESAGLNPSTIGEPGVSGSVISQDMIDCFVDHSVNKKGSTVSIKVLRKDFKLACLIYFSTIGRNTSQKILSRF